MYLLHLSHVVEDVQSTRQREARQRAVSRLLARAARARARPVQPGALRQALAFALIEAGLRLVTPGPAARRTPQRTRTLL